MALSDNKRLYDIATRLAVYTEGVKVQYAREFNAVAFEVSETLKDLLGRVRYRTLDGLTKAQLNKLIIQLRKSQSKIYSNYTEKLMRQLREFMAADLEVNRRVWVTGFIELDDDSEKGILSDEDAVQFLIDNPAKSMNPLLGLAAVTGGDDRIWSQIVNAPIPANGLYLLPFIKTFSNSAQTSIENVIRKAWANRLAVEETLNILVGDGENKQGTSSQVDRIIVQASAVVHTAMAHVAAITSAAVISTVFGWYGWFSVMDGRTTEICISRNLKVYRFGEGPMPPAHIRCRSHTAPVVGNGDLDDETFYTWILRQPSDVQDDILTEEGGEALRDGKIRAKDIPRYESNQPLTIKQFRSKVKEILSRRYGVPT